LTEADLSIETNEHRNKTRNQTTSHKTMNNTASHSDDGITKKHIKRKNHLCENHLFDWKRGKKMQRGDCRSKNDLKSPLSTSDRERKPKKKVKFLSLKLTSFIYILFYYHLVYILFCLSIIYICTSNVPSK